MSNSNQKNIDNNYSNNEVSIKEFITIIKSWILYLRSKWAIVLAFSLFGACIGFCYAYLQKTKYTASLTFVLEDEKSGGSIVSALGFANSLGLDLGGGNGGGAFSGANLMELMKSRTLVEKALLYPIETKQNSQSLATYYIEHTNLNKEWKNHPELKNIQFASMTDLSLFNRAQDSVMGVLYSQMVGSQGILAVTQKDKKVSIITIDVIFSDEQFAKTFAEAIAKVVSDFYVETRSKKARENFEILQKQTDSIRNELNGAITGVAIANDNTYNLNPALNIKRTPSAKRQVDVQANTAILTQLVTNLEMAKVTLRRETPLIQIIDRPILPLEKHVYSKRKLFVIGGVIGGIIIILILGISKVWKKIIEG